ncbi:MAG TPA: hypothetical protein VFO78_10690 [Candidatus Limnocylindrales bacterium]|nr:hypothetical protein [Candidatus Limnocylindrales bacterium]
MHRTRTLGGVVLIATGLVWIGQGTGLIGGGSFMVGDPFWAWLGLVGVVAGIAFIVLDARRPLGPR